MIRLWRLKGMNVAKTLYHDFNVLCNKNLSSIIIRRLNSNYFFQLPPSKLNLKSNMKLKHRDAVSDDSILVYKSSMGAYLRWSQPLAYSILVYIAFTIYKYKLLWNNEKSVEEKNKVETGQNFTENEKNEMRWLLGGLILGKVVIIMLCRHWVHRIWFSSEKKQYTMCLLGDIPGTTKRVVFKYGEAKEKYENSRYSLFRLFIFVRNKTYIISENNFVTPSEYTKLLGYVFNGIKNEK